MKVLLSIPLMVFACSSMLSAQPFKIREEDKAYSTTIVREINLNHPSNQSLFGKKALLSEMLLEATKKGYLQARQPEDPETELSLWDVIKNISIPSDSGFCFEQYLPSQLYLIELQEEFIFDKNRSEFRFIPKYITLFIPPEVNYRGIMQPIATWKYEDCKKLFLSDKRAFSQSKGFGKSKINFHETFLLRSYRSEIVKIGGTEPYFDQLHPDPEQAFLLGQAKEYELQEMIYKVYHPE